MVQPLPIQRATLTGRTRFRMSFLRRLVLQVEVKRQACRFGYGPDLDIMSEWLEWQDATIEDLHALDLMTTFKPAQDQEKVIAPLGPGLTS